MRTRQTFQNPMGLPVAASAVALLLPCAVVQADPLAPPVTLTAMPVVTASAQAVGQELLDFLSAKAGGQAALFKRITGADPTLTQSLSLQLLPNQFSVGDMTYDNALIKVTSRTTSLSNCGATIAPSMTDSQQGTYATLANWSSARSATGTITHAVAVTAGYSAFGASVKTEYTFTDAQANTTQNSQGTQVSSTTQWATSQTFQAAENTTAVMRHDVVSVTGGENNVQYSLSPTVQAGATLNFIVSTAGLDARKTVTDIFETGGPNALGFGNPAAPSSNLPADDKWFPTGALIWSADGRFVYGREKYAKGRVTSQIFSVVDLAATTSSASPVRLISYTCAGPKSPRDLPITVFGRLDPLTQVIARDGAAHWYCDGKIKATVGSATSTCLYIGFPGNDGRLACFDQSVSGMSTTDALKHVTGWLQGTAQTPLNAQNQLIFTQYQIPLSQVQTALGMPLGDVNMTLTGSFSGEHQILETKCLQSYALAINGKGKCNQQRGMVSTDRTVCPDTTVALQRQFKKKAADVYVVNAPGTGSQVGNAQ